MTYPHQPPAVPPLLPAAPTMVPMAAAPVRRPLAATLSKLSLFMAAVWLVVSVAVAAWLFTGADSGPVRLGAEAPSLTARAAHSSYGGDAYTGIQNAAADTENAVVDGTNAMTQLSTELAEASARLDRDASSRVQRGLAVLVVGLGLLNFTVAASRAPSD